MIWSGGTNINIWLVRNGWSFYLLDSEQPKEHRELIAAEEEAKNQQVGLWKSDLQ